MELISFSREEHKLTYLLTYPPTYLLTYLLKATMELISFSREEHKLIKKATRLSPELRAR